MTRNEKPWTHFCWIDPARDCAKPPRRIAAHARRLGIQAGPDLLCLRIAAEQRQPLTGMTASPMMNGGGEADAPVGLA